ncbi:hypothetical protein ACKGJY_10175 [Hyunsoonleella sp. 2307UL5-6]|uniref:hypothetical protein n=1 Tax=Hyunsoonleella sp. 2307UL5-6 TaxID=3384768 RepID=UPI0039BC3E73
MTESAYDVACKSNDPQQILEDLKAYYYHFGGYGDQHQELEFIKRFFQQVFKNYPQLEALEWHQYQDYNDNYMCFDLHSFLVNKKFYFMLGGLDWFDIEDWKFSFMGLQEDNHKFWEGKDNTSVKDWETWKEKEAAIQLKCTPLIEPLNLIIAFLKSLYDFYKPYYFIYVFGRRAKVEITKKGIRIDTENIYYEDDKSTDFRIKPL